VPSAELAQGSAIELGAQTRHNGSVNFQIATIRKPGLGEWWERQLIVAMK